MRHSGAGLRAAPTACKVTQRLLRRRTAPDPKDHVTLVQIQQSENRGSHAKTRLTIELSCKDEARFGQKGRVCHRWFTRGQRRPGLCDQRYTWAHLFATVQPKTGRAFALVLPELNTQAMQLFLDKFAATLASDEHAVMVADQAGWHIAEDLMVPKTISLLLQPAYSPELNPVERVWLYLRERHLSHRLLNSYEAILDALCKAWNALTAERLTSLTDYPYLKQVSF